MSKQRVIKDELWDDEWFYELDPVEKLVWVFLLTNPRNNIAGVYQLSRRYGANATGLDTDVFVSVLTRFSEADKIKLSDEWIVLCNFHKHQSKNPKVEAGVVRILESLPYNILSLLPMDSLYIAYPTLLNSTLLNLYAEPKGSGSKKKLNKTNMGFNKYSDDYEEGTIDINGDGSVKKEATKRHNSTCYDIFAVFEKVLGKYPLNWKVNKTERACAENLSTERGLAQVEKALSFYKEHKGDEFCPDVSSPYLLDSKWSKLFTYKNKQG